MKDKFKSFAHPYHNRWTRKFGLIFKCDIWIIFGMSLCEKRKREYCVHCHECNLFLFACTLMKAYQIKFIQKGQ